MGFVDGPSVDAYARSDPLYFVDPDGRNVINGLKGLYEFGKACFRFFFKKPGRIRVLERDGDTIIYSVRTKPGDEIQIIANQSKRGRDLVLEQVHIQGGGPGTSSVRELRDFARTLGRQQGADNVIISGATRTTGAGPGRVPATIRIRVK